MMNKHLLAAMKIPFFSVLDQFVPLYFRHPTLNLWHFLLGLDTQYFLGILINIDDIPLSWDWVDRIILWKLDQLSSLLSWKRSCGEFYVNFPTILRHFSNIYYWTNWVLGGNVARNRKCLPHYVNWLHSMMRSIYVKC